MSNRDYIMRKSVMSNDNTAIARVFKLWAKTSMMIVDGRRDATVVADVLQTILGSTRSLRFEGRWFDLDENVPLEDANLRIGSEDKENPWTPIKIEYVLPHGETFPEEQYKFPIVGLVLLAEFGDHRNVGCLFSCNIWRIYHPVYSGHGWTNYSRFYAAREIHAF